MADSAQRMVDIFLGAAVPKEQGALEMVRATTFKAAVDAEATGRRPFSVFVDGDEERAAEIASRMSAEAGDLAGAPRDEVIARVLEIAAEAAPGLPAGTAEYALKLFITHNPIARDLRLPNLLSRMSPSQAEPLLTMKLASGFEIVSEIEASARPRKTGSPGSGKTRSRTSIMSIGISSIRSRRRRTGPSCVGAARSSSICISRCSPATIRSG